MTQGVGLSWSADTGSGIDNAGSMTIAAGSPVAVSGDGTLTQSGGSLTIDSTLSLANFSGNGRDVYRQRRVDRDRATDHQRRHHERRSDRRGAQLQQPGSDHAQQRTNLLQRPRSAMSRSWPSSSNMICSIPPATAAISTTPVAARRNTSSAATAATQPAAATTCCCPTAISTPGPATASLSAWPRTRSLPPAWPRMPIPACSLARPSLTTPPFMTPSSHSP